MIYMDYRQNILVLNASLYGFLSLEEEMGSLLLLYLLDMHTYALG